MVAILFLLYIVSMLDRNIFNLLGEHVRQDMGLSDMQLSLLYGPAFAVTYAVSGLPLGWALDRFSRRKVVWGAVSLWSLGTMFCGLARGFPQLFGARSLVGAGEAVMVPANQTILADMFPPDRLAFPLSIYSIGAMMGMGLSLALGGLLTRLIDPAGIFPVPILGDVAGWQLIFLVVGAPGLLIAMLIFLVREPPRHRTNGKDTPPTGYADYLAFARQNWRFMIGLHVGGILATLVMNSILAWTPAHFIRVFGWPVEQVGLWLGVAMIAGPCIGMPIHGLVVNRLLQRGIMDGQIRYLIGALLLTIPFIVIAFTTVNPVLGLVMLAIGMGFLNAFGVLMPTALMLVVPGELRGKAAAVVLLVTAAAGIGLGPTVTATISKILGEDQIGLSLAIVTIVGLPAAALAYSFTMKKLRTISI